MTTSEILERYVLLHNQGVETGNFEPLLLLMAPDAILDFQYPAIGTYIGLPDIRTIFRRNPPQFLMVVDRIIEKSLTISADYYDQKYPSTRIGSIKIETDGEKIKSVFICI